MGWSVIAVDCNPEAPGFALADEQIVLSTYAAEPIIAKLRDLVGDYDIRGVINRSSGPPVVTAAYICQALSLPGIPPQAAATIVNKAAFMTACAQLGIPAPCHQAVRSLSEVNWEVVRYPAVLKPSLSLVGKSGVYLVEHKDALLARFSNVQAMSYNDLVEIEEFIQGRDVGLIAMVSQGELLPVVMLDEFNKLDCEAPLRAIGLAIPSVFSGLIEEKRVHALGRKIIGAFGLDSGTTPFMMSCRCEKGGEPVVIEIHLDLGGDLILDELFPASTDFDFMKLVVEVMTGEYSTMRQLKFRSVALLFDHKALANGKRGFRLLRAKSRGELEESLRQHRALNTH